MGDENEIELDKNEEEKEEESEKDEETQRIITQPSSNSNMDALMQRHLSTLAASLKQGDKWNPIIYERFLKVKTYLLSLSLILYSFCHSSEKKNSHSFSIEFIATFCFRERLGYGKKYCF